VKWNLYFTGRGLWNLRAACEVRSYFTGPWPVKSFLYFTGLLHWAASLCRFQNFSFWPQNLAGSFLVQQFAQKIVGDKLRQCFINRRPIVGKETDQHPLTGHGFFFKHDADFAHAQPEKRGQLVLKLKSRHLCHPQTL